MRSFMQILEMLEPGDRWRLAGILTLLVASAGLDFISIGLVVPFVGTILEPDAILENQIAGPMLRDIGVTGQQGIIFLVGSLLVAAVTFKNVAVIVQLRVVLRFLARKKSSLSTRLFDSYMAAPYTFHAQRNTSTLIRNITVEVSEGFTGVLSNAMTFVADTMIVFALMALLLVVNPLVSISAIAVLSVISGALVFTLRHRLRRLGAARVQREGEVIQYTNEALGGVKEIKVFGRGDYFARRFQHSMQSLVTAQTQGAFYQQLPRPLLEPVAMIGFVGLVFSLFFLTDRGLTDNLPLLAVFGAVSVRLLPVFTRTTQALNQLRFSAPAIETLYTQLHDAESAAETAQPDVGEPVALKERIDFDGVEMRYPGTVAPALSSVTLSIKRHMSVAFVGATGAGKTTLVNLLLGLLQPTAGRVLIDGVDMRQNVESWQRQCGYIPQDIFLLDDTIRRNVAFGIPDEEVDDDAVWRALDAAQLAEFVRGLPEVLDAWVGERGVRISGGQRQRIGIARALYWQPDVLVLDEATSSLDYETERQLASAITSLAAGKTLITITHRLGSVRHCDIIHVLSGGAIAASGTFRDLLDSSPAFQQLVEASDLTT